MLTKLLLSSIIVLIQISGAYLRYLPFKPYMEQKDIRLLFRRILLWSAIWVFLNAWLLSWSELHMGIYKIIFFFGWLPYFLISMTVIRNQPVQHIFVLGMQCLWAMTLHTLTGMLENFIPEMDGPRIFFVHPVLYLVLFLLSLPWQRRLFLRLLPSPYLFEKNAPRLPIALLPLLIFLSVSFPIADTQGLHSIRIQISRFILPALFFFMYRAMSISSRQVESERQAEQISHLMKQQISTLREHNLLLEKNRQQTSEMSEQLKKEYQQLERLLDAGDADGAMEFILLRGDTLESTSIQPFSPSPIINTALSIYILRARKLGISVSHRINLMPFLGADEHDFSVLLANLLENAINASKEMPPEQRAITITLQHEESRCVMDIANRSDVPLIFDEEGLPCTSRKGHGLGMASLSSFMKKYHAYAKFTQEEGWVRCSMYWEITT